MSDQEKLATKMMVTFSKRRKGLYGKASELCTHFDAQIAVLVVSSAGNPFAFGHSSVDQVLRRAAARFGDAGERRIAKAKDTEGVGVRAMQARELAGLLGAWIERKLEACTTVEELKILKIECLALRQKIVEKLRNDESFSGGEEGFGNEDVGYSKYDMSFLNEVTRLGLQEQNCMSFQNGETALGLQEQNCMSFQNGETALGLQEQNCMSFQDGQTALGLQEQNCMSFAMANSDCDGGRNDIPCWGEKAPFVTGYFGLHERNDMSFAYEFGRSTEATFGFDFQGQSSYAFDFEREFAEMQRAL